MDLLMQAGETVVVVSREESDWWRGEVDGRTGVFPSNYVQPAPCEYGIISVADPDPGSGAFLTPGIRDG
jgi:hypothetical protein